MSKKITKQDKIEFIQSFLSTQGKRMTNLVKAPVSKLDEIIAKYEINVEQMWCEKEEQIFIRKKEQREQDEKWIIDKQIRKLLEKEMEKKWINLTDNERRELYLMKFEKSYKQDPVEVEKHNNEIKLCSEGMMRNFVSNGMRVIRESDNELRVNGIVLNCGHLEKVTTFEEALITMMEEDQQTHTYMDEQIMEIINMKAEDNFSGSAFEFEIEIKIKPRQKHLKM